MCGCCHAWASLCYQAIPFVMDFKLGRAGTSKTSPIPSSVSLMIDQVEYLRTEGGKVKTSIITSGSDLAKPLLVGETSLCTDSLLFCAPEALALLSTAGAACAHIFYYTCRRRFCSICPQEHPVTGKS